MHGVFAGPRFYNAAMARPFDVCVRGSGIVGRTLALHLAAKRLRVALVRQDLASHPAHADVRAYALNARSRALLQAIRCWPALEHATPVVAMEVFGDQGGAVRFDAGEQGVDALNWIVDVPALEGMLQEATRFQPQIEEVPAPVAAELTVVCEGRASSTRAEFGVEFEVRPYGQSALASRVTCAVPHAQVARQWFDAGDITALLPLGGPAGNVCALVWSVSPEKARQLQGESEASFCQLLEAATHGALGALDLCGPRHVWALQAAQAQRWCGTRASTDATQPLAWALAGDAAHNVHPLAGQGLNLGLGDVATLVRILDARPYWRSVGDLRLLRAYERERKADYTLVGGSGDALQKLFSHHQGSVQSLRNAGMNGFSRSGPLKQWVARRAMGLAQTMKDSAL